ncbi:aldehyde dehydrogenase family protein [Coprothermobacter platensis]|uniref:aldehyde dehydrogenase family protein n=1 Tax=Coprothermobacter platensis TaxID=108819 RepID=UPI000362F494|nr:aldehyde dehydrogenase family protein [Coprothermobacter platensis]
MEVQKVWDDSYKMLIGGKFVDASDGKTIKSYCPADGELLASFPEATKEDVDTAVKAAWKAFESWKNVSAAERQDILMKIADAIDANKQKLAMIETMDNGKPIRESMGDIMLGADHFRYFAGVVRSEEDQASIINDPGSGNNLSIILREPIGVVGQIIPWNFPFLMAAWKLAPVIAAGCCTVIKPSNYTSLSLLELAKLIAPIVPPGVINIVTGRGSTTGQYLLDHPDFRKLAFTGSTEVGYSVSEAATKKLIPATLELGGKSANIFFSDCNWRKAIDGAEMGILYNQGQVCCAGSRIFVQEDIYDKFVAELVEAFKKVKVGLPWEHDTQMGSQVSQEQLDKILSYVEIGKKEGAKVAVGGERNTEGPLAKGFFMKPTLLIDVDNKMRVAQEEIFGPVACVIKFKNEEDAIAMANDTQYGLAGAVWTQDINRAIRVARGIEAGKVWVNQYNNLPAGTPFGGYKKSGIGRETHKMIIDEYSEIKNIFISLDENPTGLY